MLGVKRFLINKTSNERNSKSFEKLFINSHFSFQICITQRLQHVPICTCMSTLMLQNLFSVIKFNNTSNINETSRPAHAFMSFRTTSTFVSSFQKYFKFFFSHLWPIILSSFQLFKHKKKKKKLLLHLIKNWFKLLSGKLSINFLPQRAISTFFSS